VLVLPALPDDHPERASLEFFTELILRELPEMAAEVGCPVVPAAVACIGIPVILVGPAAWNAAFDMAPAETPCVRIDRENDRVVIDAPTLAGVGQAFQLLRAAIAERREMLVPSTCGTAGEVIDRLDAEVRRTFPLLQERAPSWYDAVGVARDTMRDADDLATIQRLMANLLDAHSWAKDARVTGRLPYHLHDNGVTVRFWSVPETSAGWAHGVRSGDIALAPNTAPWRERTGSAAHARPWNIGYRALQGRVGEDVDLAAIRRDGSTVRWTEPSPSQPWDEPMSIGRIDERTGYLRVRGWVNSAEWMDAFTAALAEMQRYERLVVDLRGNVGGALVAAQNARARFLSGRTVLGTIRYSTVTGQMDAPHEITGEPSPDGPRWTKPVRFLTDPLCYSATEDFLQGLQGLPHVHLVGQTTGGGSGRPRTVALRPDIFATISTALTYDRNGRCIEGNGFTPDIAIPADPTDPDATLRHAIGGW
jgi:carboxyl-terminal processing protease